MGRPKKQEDDLWAPVKYYKPKEKVEIDARAKMANERIMAGYKELYKLVHDKDMPVTIINRIGKIIAKLDV